MVSQRASKKQRELLSFIDGFIKGNGYAPSYREVMQALGYKSVSTVAAHVAGLVAKGYLRKGGDYSARSIEVVHGQEGAGKTDYVQWLEKRVEALLAAGQTPRELIAAYLTVLDDVGSEQTARYREQLIDHPTS